MLFRSFQILLSLNFYNLLMFPLGMFAYKIRTGFINTYDTAFWIGATSWQTLVYAFFIYNALSFSLESIAESSWIPLGLSAVLVWPLGYLNFSLQGTPKKVWMWNTEQSIYFVGYTTHVVISLLIIAVNMGKATLYMDRHFLEPPSIEPIVSVDQVYDSIDYELRDKIYEEIDSVNEGEQGEEEEDGDHLNDLYFKKIALPKKMKVFATL